MEEFLKAHVFEIVALSFTIVGFVWALARKDAKIVELSKEVELLKADVKKVSDDLAHHRENIDRHVDPKRDENRWADLLQRIGRIDEKLEHLGRIK